MDTIEFKTIDRSGRARKDYNHIPELAQSILDNGLIQPLVLVQLADGTIALDAGGRRSTALEFLINAEEWDGILYHGLTSVPGKAGYVLKGESFSTPLQRMLTEIAENRDREDMDWRDETVLIHKAFRESKRVAHANGEDILMRDFGSMVGCGYMNLRAMETIHDDLLENPDRYRECTNVRQAMAKLAKVAANELIKIQAARLIVDAPKIDSTTKVEITTVEDHSDPKPAIAIPLSSAFACCDSLAYMRSLRIPTYDHIVTDPDYAISIERLEAGVAHASDGVHQDSVADSLAHLYEFIELAFRVLKDTGCLVFWYDIDHHEKLRDVASSVGFAVQRWPLIWRKTDYRSNAAPAFNFCKNVEYAMVCRKPGATLAKVQMSCIYDCASFNTVKEFGHPFAKPLEISRWILNAIAIKGQSVYDPFLGSGAIACAAAEFGLKPTGSEIDPNHYANSIMNLQKTYRKLIGNNVSFS